MPDDTGGYAEYGFVAEYYDYVATYAERRGRRPSSWTWRGDTGGPVLELGCGTGRVLIPTRARRHRDHRARPLTGHAGRLQTRLAAEPPESRRGSGSSRATCGSFDLGQEFGAGHPAVPAVPTPRPPSKTRWPACRPSGAICCRTAGSCSTCSTRRSRLLTTTAGSRSRARSRSSRCPMAVASSAPGGLIERRSASTRCSRSRCITT